MTKIEALKIIQDRLNGATFLSETLWEELNEEIEPFDAITLIIEESDFELVGNKYGE